MRNNTTTEAYFTYMNDLGEPIAQKEDAIWIFGAGYGDEIEFSSKYEKAWETMEEHYKDYNFVRNE